MAISVNASGEKRHWSTVDLWSDGQHRPVYAETALDDEQIAQLEALREASVEADIPLPLTTSTVTDDEVLQYLRSPAMSSWSYFLLRLSCWFKQGSNERFTEADLRTNLACAGATDGQPPVAWSMSPLVVQDGDEQTATLTIGADLKFLNAQISRQAKTSQGTLVQAYGLLSSRPSWRFTATRIGKLEGTFQLDMIVRAAAGVHATADVALDVALERHRRLAPSRPAKVKGATKVEIDFPADGQHAT